MEGYFLHKVFQANMVLVTGYSRKGKHGTLNREQVCFCGRVPWLNQYWPGDSLVFVVLCPGTPEGSTGSGSGFKASQKTGPRFKVSSDRLGEAGNRTCDPSGINQIFIVLPEVSYKELLI